MIKAESFHLLKKIDIVFQIVQMRKFQGVLHILSGVGGVALFCNNSTMKIGDLELFYSHWIHQERIHKELSKSFVRCLLLNAD